MMISRIYHTLHLDHTDNGADKIFYVLLPEEPDNATKEKMDSFASEHQVNVVLVSGFDWEACMTPWPSDNPFKKSRPFTGKADAFLEDMKVDLMFNLEHSMNVSTPDRYLIGISLSGLFALWSTARKDLFSGVASISGSLWYEGFQDWFLSREEIFCDRFYLSLGESEKKSRHKAVTEVQERTEAICAYLRASGREVFYNLNGDGHCENVHEKIMDAITALSGDSAVNLSR